MQITMLSQEASLLSSSENGLDRTWQRGTLLLNTINNQVCRVLATVKWQKYVPEKKYCTTTLSHT